MMHIIVRLNQKLLYSVPGAELEWSIVEPFLILVGLFLIRAL